MPPQPGATQWTAPAPYPGGPAAGPVPDKEGKGAAFWILLIGALAAVGGAAIALVLIFGGGDSSPEAEIARCAIEADGTMTAAGWVQSDDPITVEVSFEDADSGKELDNTTAKSVRGPRGRQAWTATGKTDDDDVQKVTCVLSLPD